MNLSDKMIRVSMEKPKLVTLIMIVLALLFGAMMTGVKVDTDPENMLSEKEVVRVFHHQVKETFTLYDVVVVGVVNDKNPDGVFNQETLTRIYELTRLAKNLSDPEDPEKRVVARNVIAPRNPGKTAIQALVKLKMTPMTSSTGMRTEAAQINSTERIEAPPRIP